MSNILHLFPNKCLEKQKFYKEESFFLLQYYIILSDQH